MKTVKETVKVRGVLNIKLVDKKNGRVVYQKRLENDLHAGFATAVCGELAGEENVYLGRIDKVELYDASNNLIKTLSPPTVLERISADDHEETHARWEDSSSDSYTVDKVYMIAKYTINTTEHTTNIAFKTGVNTSTVSYTHLTLPTN